MILHTYMFDVQFLLYAVPVWRESSSELMSVHALLCYLVPKSLVLNRLSAYKQEPTEDGYWLCEQSRSSETCPTMELHRQLGVMRTYLTD